MRGLLNEGEVEAAKASGYLKGVHVLVATPDNLASVRSMRGYEGIFTDLKAVAVDEVDACFNVGSPSPLSLPLSPLLSLTLSSSPSCHCRAPQTPLLTF